MVKKLVLLASSVSLTIMACELVLRYAITAPPFERALFVPSYLTWRDAPLRWRFSPAEGRNSLGLRNRELSPKNTGAYRILFLGDSLIWSGETSAGALYTEVLEHRLNSRLSNGSHVFEVINAGIPGYTTYQELEFLRIYGIDMSPDIVVLGFVFNDLYYKYLHKPTNQTLLGGEPTARLHRLNPDAFPGTLFARSYLAHAVAARSELIWKRLRGRPVFPFEQREDFYLAWKAYGWKQVRTLLGEMRALVTDTGSSLAVLVFPVSDQVDDRYRALDEAYVLYPQGQIRDICNDYAIPMLDLTEPIHRQGGTTLFRDYLHLNGKGNDVVATELEKYLVDEFHRRRGE